MSTQGDPILPDLARADVGTHEGTLRDIKEKLDSSGDVPVEKKEELENDFKYVLSLLDAYKDALQNNPDVEELGGQKKILVSQIEALRSKVEGLMAVSAAHVQTIETSAVDTYKVDDSKIGDKPEWGKMLGKNERRFRKTFVDKVVVFTYKGQKVVGKINATPEAKNGKITVEILFADNSTDSIKQSVEDWEASDFRLYNGDVPSPPMLEVVKPSVKNPSKDLSVGDTEKTEPEISAVPPQEQKDDTNEDRKRMNMLAREKKAPYDREVDAIGYKILDVIGKGQEQKEMVRNIWEDIIDMSDRKYPPGEIDEEHMYELRKETFELVKRALEKLAKDKEKETLDEVDFDVDAIKLLSGTAINSLLSFVQKAALEPNPERGNKHQLKVYITDNRGRVENVWYSYPEKNDPLQTAFVSPLDTSGNRRPFGVEWNRIFATKEDAEAAAEKLKKERNIREKGDVVFVYRNKKVERAVVDNVRKDGSVNVKFSDEEKPKPYNFDRVFSSEEEAVANAKKLGIGLTQEMNSIPDTEGGREIKEKFKKVYVIYEGKVVKALMYGPAEEGDDAPGYEDAVRILIPKEEIGRDEDLKIFFRKDSEVFRTKKDAISKLKELKEEKKNSQNKIELIQDHDNVFLLFPRGGDSHDFKQYDVGIEGLTLSTFREYESTGDEMRCLLQYSGEEDVEVMLTYNSSEKKVVGTVIINNDEPVEYKQNANEDSFEILFNNIKNKVLESISKKEKTPKTDTIKSTTGENGDIKKTREKEIVKKADISIENGKLTFSLGSLSELTYDVSIEGLQEPTYSDVHKDGDTVVSFFVNYGDFRLLVAYNDDTKKIEASAIKNESLSKNKDLNKRLTPRQVNEEGFDKIFNEFRAYVKQEQGKMSSAKMESGKLVVTSEGVANTYNVMIEGLAEPSCELIANGDTSSLKRDIIRLTYSEQVSLDIFRTRGENIVKAGATIGAGQNVILEATEAEGGIQNILDQFREKLQKAPTAEHKRPDVRTGEEEKNDKDFVKIENGELILMFKDGQTVSFDISIDGFDKPEMVHHNKKERHELSAWSYGKDWLVGFVIHKEDNTIEAIGSLSGKSPRYISGKFTFDQEGVNQILQITKQKAQEMGKTGEKISKKVDTEVPPDKESVELDREIARIKKDLDKAREALNDAVKAQYTKTNLIKKLLPGIGQPLGEKGVSIEDQYKQAREKYNDLLEQLREVSKKQADRLVLELSEEAKKVRMGIAKEISDVQSDDSWLEKVGKKVKKGWNALGKINIATGLEKLAEKKPNSLLSRFVNSKMIPARLSKGLLRVIGAKGALSIGAGIGAVTLTGPAAAGALAARSIFSFLGGSIGSGALMDTVHKSRAKRNIAVYESADAAEEQIRQDLNRVGTDKKKIGKKIEKQLKKKKFLNDFGDTPEAQQKALSDIVMTYESYASVHGFDLAQDSEYQRVLALYEQSSQALIEKQIEHVVQGETEVSEADAKKMMEVLGLLDSADQERLKTLGIERGKRRKKIGWAIAAGVVSAGVTNLIHFLKMQGAAPPEAPPHAHAVAETAKTASKPEIPPTSTSKSEIPQTPAPKPAPTPKPAPAPKPEIPPTSVPDVVHASGGVPEEVTIGKGDNPWNVIKRELDVALKNNSAYQGLTDSGKDYIVDGIKDQYVQNPDAYRDSFLPGHTFKVGKLVEDYGGMDKVLKQIPKVDPTNPDNNPLLEQLAKTKERIRLNHLAEHAKETTKELHGEAAAKQFSDEFEKGNLADGKLISELPKNVEQSLNITNNPILEVRPSGTDGAVDVAFANGEHITAIPEAVLDDKGNLVHYALHAADSGKSAVAVSVTEHATTAHTGGGAGSGSSAAGSHAESAATTSASKEAAAEKATTSQADTTKAGESGGTGKTEKVTDRGTVKKDTLPPKTKDTAGKPAQEDAAKADAQKGTTEQESPEKEVAPEDLVEFKRMSYDEMREIIDKQDWTDVQKVTARKLASLLRVQQSIVGADSAGNIDGHNFTKLLRRDVVAAAGIPADYPAAKEWIDAQTAENVADIKRATRVFQRSLLKGDPFYTLHGNIQDSGIWHPGIDSLDMEEPTEKVRESIEGWKLEPLRDEFRPTKKVIEAAMKQDRMDSLSVK